MGETTGISWTHHTANFWMGCQRVSPGCQKCYAETLVTTRMRLPVWGPPSTTERHRTKSAWVDVPRWNRAAKRDGVRRRLFVSSLADVFEDHPAVAPWRAEALDLLAQCDGLDVQLLTKRPENILDMVPRAWRSAWPQHVWVGTTVEDQRRAEERIPELLDVPAPVRFLSMEPLLEPVDLSEWLAPQSHCNGCGESHDGHVPDECPSCDTDALITTFGGPQAERWRTGERYDHDSWRGRRDIAVGIDINWIIVGGESGVGARAFDVAWVRSILKSWSRWVPVFVKQLGAHAIDSAQYDVIGPSGAVHYVRAVGDDALAREAAALPAYSTRPHSVSRTIRDRAGAAINEWPLDIRIQEFPR